MRLKLSAFIQLWAIFCWLLAAGSQRVFAAPEGPQFGPQPLPRDCIGVTPVGQPPLACCLYIYVYLGGAPIANADITVTSSYGQVSGKTAYGSYSAQPYFNTGLSNAPLSIQAGEVIKITASYNGMVSSRMWTVQNNAQQVDLGLVAGYQAPVAQQDSLALAESQSGISSGKNVSLPNDAPSNASSSGTINSSVTQYLYNSSFEAGTGSPAYFSFVGPCNYTVYENAGTAYNGSRFLATNKNSNSNCYSFRQDIAGLTPTVGQTYRYAMWVRSSDGTPRSGEIVIWGLSGGSLEHSQGGGWFTTSGTNWQCVETYLTVNNPGNRLVRSEMYLNSNDNIDYFFDQGTFTVGGGSLCPHAGFGANVTNGSAPLNVTFADQSVGVYDSCVWDFGDSGTSNACSPSHTYLNPGIYNVSLLINGMTGADTQFKSGYITVTQSTLAAFTASPTSGIVPLSVTFIDQSIGDLLTWTWDFGDGVLSGARYPTHVYASANTYSVALTVTGPAGQNTLSKPGHIIAQNGVRTLILVNRAKMTALYGSSAVDEMISKLNLLAASGTVNGIVLQLDADPDVTSAVTTRGTDYTNKNKANALAQAIRQLLLNQWKLLPLLKYAVLVGDDRSLPFYRMKDGNTTPDPLTLTDDYYVDQAPTACTGCANSIVYIPDLALGRLVESPAQISGQVDTFLANSTLDLNSALVAGYDFVDDGAQAHCNSYWGEGLTPDCTLIGDSWTASQLVSKGLNTYHSTVSLNNHANEYGFGTPSGSISVNDFVNSPVDFSRAIFYSVGCHAGHNMTDGLDLAESLAIKKANYAANTGYGWGGTGVVYSEELTWNFTRQMLQGSGTTLGLAMMQAKQQYFTDHPQPDKTDEKITAEFTLYGLPMYQITSLGANANRPAAAPGTSPDGLEVSSSALTLSNGLAQESKSITWPLPLPNNTTSGSFYTLNGVVAANNGEPILPRLSYNVGYPGYQLMGLVFTGGTYNTVKAAPPIQDIYTTNQSRSSTPKAFTAPGWYPSIFALAHHLDLAAGAKEEIWATAGQYNPNLAGGQQRIFTGMNFNLYYQVNPGDLTAPRLYSMHSQLSSNASVQVQAVDASGILAAVIAYTDGVSAWQSVSLTNSNGTWVGSFPASANTEFFVQVVDKAGNVTSVDQGGRYFRPGENWFEKFYLPIVTR